MPFPKIPCSGPRRVGTRHLPCIADAPDGFPVRPTRSGNAPVAARVGRARRPGGRLRLNRGSPTCALVRYVGADSPQCCAGLESLCRARATQPSRWPTKRRPGLDGALPACRDLDPMRPRRAVCRHPTRSRRSAPIRGHHRGPHRKVTGRSEDKIHWKNTANLVDPRSNWSRAKSRRPRHDFAV